MQESDLFELAMLDFDKLENETIEPLEKLLSVFCEKYDYDSFIALVDEVAASKSVLEKLLKNVHVYLDPDVITLDEMHEIKQRLEDISSNFNFIASTVIAVIDSELFEIKMQEILEVSEQGSENGE